MTLRELRFKGYNGHSRILIMPSREEIKFPLVRVGDLTLLDISRNRHKRLGESEGTFQRREIETHVPIMPLNTVYFASSGEHEGLYLGVQYYRAAIADDTLEDRVPASAPQIFRLPHLKRSDYNLNTFLSNLELPNGAQGYNHVSDICGKVVLVQYYRPR